MLLVYSKTKSFIYMVCNEEAKSWWIAKTPDEWHFVQPT